MNMKSEQAEEGEPKGSEHSGESSNRVADPQKDYEQMLQKLEAETRNHIRVEQQLKLHIESIQSKLDETEAQQKPTKLLTEVCPTR